MSGMQLNDPSLLRKQCYIGGEWLGKPVSEVRNPATGDIIAEVPYLGAEQTRTAIEAASLALITWSKRTAAERASFLHKWYALIMAAGDDLATLITSEQGKPLNEARGEVEYGASFIEFYAEEARRIYGETIPTFRQDSRIVVTKQPIGVCAAITPWNFPLAMITRKIAPAIAAGCTVVVKSAPETPLTALALAALAERAGIPAGVINILTGDAPAIGQEICDHPLVRFLSFTGSTAIGKLLMQQAAKTVKRVGLELGGNAPFIVFEDADLEAAVEGAIISKYRNTGQTCVCANRFFIQDALYDDFIEKLSKRVAALKVGAGNEAGIDQGPLINQAAIGKVEEHITDALAKGAKIVIGGHRHALGGTFFEPTILRDVTLDMIVSREETFGPLAPIYRFKDEVDVIAMANDVEAGLAAYFYTRNLGRAWRVAEALEYGMVGINSGLISTAIAPFGGVKQSGIGREGARHGIDEYVEMKYMLFSGLDR